MLQEFLQNPREPRLSDGAGFGLTIAPRVAPQEITWQLVKASIAVRSRSACSVRTGVRHGPLSLPNHMGQPIFAAPATRARTALAAETPRTSRRTAGDSRRAQAPTRRKARDPPGNWLFLRVMTQRPAAISAPF